MRVIAIIGAAAALLSIVTSGQAAPLYEGPWCGVYYGSKSGAPRCDFETFEQCRLEMVAGNRGLCNINPSWNGPPPRRHKRAAHRD